MVTHPGYLQSFFHQVKVVFMLGLAGDDELEDEGEAEQRNRYRRCHHFIIYIFWTLFPARHSCKCASHPLLILSCSWFSFSQLSLKVLMRNWHFQCVQCFQCFQRQVEITSLISKGKTQSQVIICCSSSIPEQNKSQTNCSNINIP